MTIQTNTKAYYTALVNLCEAQITRDCDKTRIKYFAAKVLLADYKANEYFTEFDNDLALANRNFKDACFTLVQQYQQSEFVSDMPITIVLGHQTVTINITHPIRTEDDADNAVIISNLF